MKGKSRPAWVVALTALVVLAVSAPAAKAAFGIADWQALTCNSNVDTPLVPGLGGAITGIFPIADDPDQCNSSTPAKWYTQAAGHPPFGITDFTLNTLSGAGVNGFPDGFVKEIVIDTPEGLGVNPEATPVKCTVAELSTTPAPTCPPASLVGFNYLTVATQAPPCVVPVAGECINLRAKLPVYNLVSFDGVPSMVGFPTSTPGEPTIIVGDLDPADQHVRFTISDIHAPPGGPPIVGSRLVFNGKSTTGFSENYLTMPSNCAGGQTSILRVVAYGGAEDTASFTTAVGADGCELVPFNAAIETTASGATDSPEPATVDVQMPDQLKPLEPIANSHLLTAKVTLPEGAGLNPSVANGLTPCTDAQFKKGTDDPIACPESSKIGTVEVDTRALDQDLGGDVYVGEPLSNDPSSGNQFRIFIHAVNDRYGVNVRLIGNVFPNLQTGQLTAVVDNNPQAPFNSFKVHINGGPRGALTTPDTCGPHTTSAVFTPWSGTADVTDTSEFTLDSLPGGGPCPATLAARPFNPGYSAGPQERKAGAFSPFELRLTRPDGAQEVKRVDAKLPPGMVAKLRGVEYCPQANIDAAGAQSGTSTIANPPCPDSSFVGTSGIDAGSGPAPYHVNGNVYLAGPYKGAPVSLVFVTPAVAGPYDLGTVVVRVALNVDPETAQVNAVSDPIPHVFGGVKLDIRAIDVSINRKKFTVNPTTCRSQFFIRSDIFGGGANPANPADWFTSVQQSPFRATNCRALRFKPKFSARLAGATRRTGHPKLRTILRARKGDANVRRAAFVLPKATILDQGHIKTVCTRAQLASKTCPKKAIYGYARARSPLLDGVLKGPVYLVSSDDLLPNLLADLRGQVNVRLRGEIIGTKGRLRTVFSPTPDVAVRKFILGMRGGNRGLLVNSENLCERKRFSFLNLLAQNSRRMKVEGLQLNIPGCRKAKR